LQELNQSIKNPNLPKPVAPLFKSDHNIHVLKTLQDFSSIAKKVKLSNFFIQNFATLT
jgi:hypothetical protein